MRSWNRRCLKVKITSGDDVARLVIYGVTPDDAAAYSISVSNALGQAGDVVNVNIVGKRDTYMGVSSFLRAHWRIIGYSVPQRKRTEVERTRFNNSGYSWTKLYASIGIFPKTDPVYETGMDPPLASPLT